MSARDHSAIEELLAVRALDGLEHDDAATLEAAMVAHGDCADCRRLESGFAETAAMLAASLDPVALDDAATERLVRAAHAVRLPTTAPRPVVDELARRRSRRVPPVWIAAAAGFVLLAVVVVPRLGASTDVTTNWAQRVVRFDGAEGELAMAYVPGEPGVAFWGEDLPDPGPDRTYEIWMIDDDDAIPGGCVAPIDGRIAVFVDANVGTTDTMAVTVEPSSCPSEPTGDPVLLAALS
jgi:Anti-sigma-K factor rskA